MLDRLIETIQNGMLTVFRLEELVVIFIAMLPIVEARLAIPMAIGYGIHPLLGWLYAFIGSSAIVPLLLLILLPIIRWLSRTKIFKKIGDVLYEKFEHKSRSLKNETTSDGIQSKEAAKKYALKRFWGVFVFVAIPMPLTGVWTGSAVAAITKMKYPHAVGAIVLGNLVASGIITLLCAFLPASVINYIILAISLVAIAIVIVLIIKIILHKPKVVELGSDDKDKNVSDDKENK